MDPRRPRHPSRLDGFGATLAFLDLERSGTEGGATDIDPAAFFF